MDNLPTLLDQGTHPLHLKELSVSDLAQRSGGQFFLIPGLDDQGRLLIIYQALIVAADL